MKKFLIFDGNALIHRAYHALPPLTSHDGIMINAVYGFFSMFLKIISEQQPDFVAICFDRPTPTFRKTMYVGYQATRPQGASDLGPQFGIIQKIVEEMNIPVFAVDGYEADDVIGTISQQLVSHLGSNKDTFEVLIISGDRDLMQLVNKHVKLLMPVKGISNMALFGEKEVEEKFGIPPKKIVDLKALIGDASDNYPGVSGIGPKSAALLLKEYKNLEEIYENIALVPEKLALKLAQDAEQAALAKKLATIVLDVPIKIDVKKCMVENINWQSAKEAFEYYEFKSLLSRLPVHSEYN